MHWFNGHRSLAEQMKGLGPVLSECVGKRVLDVGTAEGLIAVEFVKAGAVVDAFDNNATYAAAAAELASKTKGLRAKWADMNEGLPAFLRPPYDIVLALAVLHKARDVRATTLLLAGACSDLLVIRLPHGCSGVLQAKHGGSVCELHGELPRIGFVLERTEPGPRGELVQYWRKR